MKLFWEKVDIRGPEDCWLWMACRHKNGYGKFAVARKIRGAHRVSWELTNGEIPDGLSVCHKCDVPPCVNPAHLFIGTQMDNLRDMGRKGRSSAQLYPETRQGERNGRHKVTEKEVYEIRAAFNNGETQSSIAQRYPIKEDTVQQICSRRTWKTLPERP